MCSSRSGVARHYYVEHIACELPKNGMEIGLNKIILINSLINDKLGLSVLIICYNLD